MLLQSEHEKCVACQTVLLKYFHKWLKVCKIKDTWVIFVGGDCFTSNIVQQCVQGYICFFFSLWQRWFINGEISCFSGSHLPLALLAMTVLLLCFLLIPLTIAISVNTLKVYRYCNDNTKQVNAFQDCYWRSGKCIQKSSCILYIHKTSALSLYTCLVHLSLHRSPNGWDTLFILWL